MQNKRLFSSLILLFVLAFVQVSFSQQDPDRIPQRDTSKVQLVGPKFSAYMELTKEQAAKINPSIDTIKAMLKAQVQRREEMRAKYQNGERPSQEDMQALRDQRQKDVDKIKSLIDNIKKELTPDQIEKLKTVELPNLEMRMGGRRRDG
jgi:hypothetical protein